MWFMFLPLAVLIGSLAPSWDRQKVRTSFSDPLSFGFADTYASHAIHSGADRIGREDDVGFCEHCCHDDSHVAFKRSAVFNVGTNETAVDGTVCVVRTRTALSASQMPGRAHFPVEYCT
jgi:hypothetical protein